MDLRDELAAFSLARFSPYPQPSKAGSEEQPALMCHRHVGDVQIKSRRPDRQAGRIRRENKQREQNIKNYKEFSEARR